MAARRQMAPLGNKVLYDSGVRTLDPMDADRAWDDDTDRSKTPGLIPGALRTTARPRLTVMTGITAGCVVPLDGQPTFLIGRSRSVDVHIDERGVSRAHCRITRAEGGFVIEDLSSTNGTFVNGVRVTVAQLRFGDRIQLGAALVLQLGLADEAEDTLARALFDASTRDALTQVYNRRYLFQRLESEVAYARRHGSPLSVLLVDLDHFKSVNDTAGHAAGDALLRAVSAELARSARAEDVVARYGGEEFAILVRSTGLGDAARFAERLRARVDALRVTVGTRTLRATVSVGVAELDECAPDAPADVLLASADARLYRAKRLGRNRIVAD